MDIAFHRQLGIWTYLWIVTKTTDYAITFHLTYTLSDNVFECKEQWIYAKELVESTGLFHTSCQIGLSKLPEVLETVTWR